MIPVVPSSFLRQELQVQPLSLSLSLSINSLPGKRLQGGSTASACTSLLPHHLIICPHHFSSPFFFSLLTSIKMFSKLSENVRVNQGARRKGRRVHGRVAASGKERKRIGGRGPRRPDPIDQIIWAARLPKCHPGVTSPAGERTHLFLLAFSPPPLSLLPDTAFPGLRSGKHHRPLAFLFLYYLFS